MFKQLAGIFKSIATEFDPLPSSGKAAQEAFEEITGMAMLEKPCGNAEQATNELAGDAKLANTCRDAQQMNKVLQRRIARLMKEKPAIWAKYFKKECGK